MNPAVPARPSLPAGRLAIGAGVVLAAFWVYAPAFHGGWVWDDGLEVAANPVVQDPLGWWKAWTRPTGLDYLPLKTILQWMEWHLWGGHVLGYHLANVLLHACGALLLWRLISKLGLPGGRLAAILFAVHPMAVESVAWIAEFKNVLSLPLLLLALITWVEGGSKARAWLWFVAALLCKPSPVLFPILLLGFAWWQRGRVTAKDVVATLPWFAASLVIGVVTLLMQWHLGMRGETPPPLARWAGANLVSYLATAAWPFAWSPVYGPWHQESGTILGWASLALVGAVAWSQRGSWGRHALLVLAWFLCATLPVVGLVPMAYARVAPRADHLGYLALAGLAAALGVVLTVLRERLSPGAQRRAASPTSAARVARAAWRRSLLGTWALPLATGALLAGWAGTARARAGVYRDERTLWAYAAQRAPDAWLARNNLGRVELGAGEPAAALAEFRAAAALEPDSAEVHANEGDALLAVGQRTEALTELRRAARLAPHVAGVRYDLGRGLLQSGDYADAIAELTAAVALDPSHAEARNNLGLALVHAGRAAEGVTQFRQALALDPKLAEAHVNLGNAAFRAGDPAAAAAEYRLALAIDPASAGAQRNLVTALRVLREGTMP